MKVDMSPEAVTERLRLMGKLSDELLNSKKVVEQTNDSEFESETLETSESGSQDQDQ